MSEHGAEWSGADRTGRSVFAAMIQPGPAEMPEECVLGRFLVDYQNDFMFSELEGEEVAQLAALLTGRSSHVSRFQTDKKSHAHSRNRII